jgi:uncharacterized membrane protein YphA (DoxX/SURF4 family)
LIDKLKTTLNQIWVEMPVRWFLGGSFFYSSLHKIMEPAKFAKIIYGYKLFPTFSINLIAIVVPYLELFAGFALILGLYPRSAALVINGLLIGFAAAISINLYRGVEFDCGCFVFDEFVSGATAAELLIKNSFFFMLGLYVIFFAKHRK